MALVAPLGFYLTTRRTVRCPVLPATSRPDVHATPPRASVIILIVLPLSCLPRTTASYNTMPYPKTVISGVQEALVKSIKMNIPSIHIQVITTNDTFFRGRASYFDSFLLGSPLSALWALIATPRVILEVQFSLQNCTSTLVSIFWYPLTAPHGSSVLFAGIM